MNAITLYTSTCRYILQADHENPESWAELYRLLPYLRQALLCCVCANLLSEPWGPRNTICQHQVCRTCIGGKMRLRPSCSWCKDYNQFVESKELRIVLACYKSLCEYVAATPIAQNIDIASNNGGPNTTVDILQEGVALRDSYQGSDLAKGLNALHGLLPKLYAHINRSSNDSHGNNAPMVTENGTATNPEVGNSPTVTFPFAHGPSTSSNGSEHAASDGYGFTNGLCNLQDRIDSGSDKSCDTVIYSKSKSPRSHKAKRKHRSLKHKKKKHKSSRRHRHERDEKRHRDGRSRSRDVERFSGKAKRRLGGGMSVRSSCSKRIEMGMIRTSFHKGTKLRFPRGLTSCRCGTNGTNPGTLPCVTQRCPCVAAEKSCANCKCKCCHNPKAKGKQNEGLVNGDHAPSSDAGADGVKTGHDTVSKKEGNISDSDSFIDVTGTAGITSS